MSKDICRAVRARHFLAAQCKTFHGFEKIIFSPQCVLACGGIRGYPVPINNRPLGELKLMKIALLAGAVALVLLCLLPGLSGQARATELGEGASALTQVNVARIKTALKLTPAQQSYWPPIEAALRDIAREQSEPEGGLIRRISRRVVAVMLNSAAAARLAAAARPLVRILSDEQRQIAVALAREMGLGPMLAAL
jgi:LTXXQ motif family protein